jgi:hypothetical protein
MDENDELNNPTGETPTPEVAQLLKILEIQSAARQRRAAPANPLQSSSFRYGSLVIITVLAFGSLGMLEWFLSALPKPATQIDGPLTLRGPLTGPPSLPPASIVKTGTAAPAPGAKSNP